MELIEIKGLSQAVNKETLKIYLEAGIAKEVLDLERQERYYEFVGYRS